MSDEAKKIIKTISLKKLKPESYRFWVSASSATLQVHNCWNIVLGQEPKPASSDENAVITPTLRKSISSWETRHSLAREALLNALEDAELVKVYQLQTAKEIWDRLAEEYGSVSDLKYARAEATLRSLIKLPTTSMKSHIDHFTRLKEERDISAPENILPLDIAQTNLAFLASLGDSWKLFHQAIGDSAQTMKTGELFAKVLAMDDSNTTSQAAAAAAAPAHALNTKYKSNNRHFTTKKSFKSQSSKPYDKSTCFYCKQRGHTIDKCHKKIWADTQWLDRKKHDNNYNNSSKQPQSQLSQQALQQTPPSNIPYWKANTTRLISFNTMSEKSDLNEWIVDTASNTHLTPFKSRLNNYHQFATAGIVEGLGSKQVSALGSGDAVLLDYSGNRFILHDVLYVPDHTASILSLNKLRHAGMSFQFLEVDNMDGDFILSADTSFHLIGHAANDILYITDNLSFTSFISTRKRRRDPSITQQHAPSSSQHDDSTPSNNWHLRLCHASTTRISKLQHILGDQDHDLLDCLACIRAKQHKLPHYPSNFKASAKGELIHSDIVGPFFISKGGSKYVLTFLDDYTHFCWVSLLPNKKATTVQHAFEVWINEIQTQGVIVKSIRTDGGGEYEGDLTPYLESLGITHEITAPYTPQANGRAERLNRTLGEMVRAMLFHAHMPQSFWAEAMDHASHVLNLLPSDAINGIPWERWTDRELSKEMLDKIHPFGTIVHAYIPRQQRWTKGKLAARSSMGCMISPKWSALTQDPTATYKYWDFECQTFNFSHHLIITARFPKDGDFGEPSAAPPVPLVAFPTPTTTPPPSQPPASQPPELPLTPQQPPSQQPPSPPSEPVLYDMIVVEPLPSKRRAFTASHAASSAEPISYDDALNRSDASQWIQAMNEEMDSIHQNGTWNLEDLPPGRKSIGVKWVFKIKRDALNNFQRYKARLVAKGYSQVAGLDFDKTFAPVVRIDSIRVLLALSAHLGLHIIHADCKTAFLNGRSDLEIYLQQPEGFISKLYPHKVLRLNKSLYGLKQAPRIWYLLLCNTICELGFVPLETDSSIYFSPALHAFLAVYVDDVLIFASSQPTCHEIFEQLNAHFKMENLGAPSSFLGLNIIRDGLHSITINQSGYIDRILTRFQMQGALPARTPLDPSLPLLQQTPISPNKHANIQLYQELIGSLNHLAVFSRPDISNAVSQLSQFLQDPSETHLKAARHVLRYLKHTRTLSIVYLRQNAPILRLFGYSDANWGGDRNDRKSHTGYLFMLNGSPVSWTSKKQTTVAVSTMEAEYMALSDASREAIARMQQLSELRCDIPPPTLLSDNQGALDIAENPTNFQRAKHIDIRFHFIRHALLNDSISIHYIPTSDNPADALTKALPPLKHQRCVQQMGLIEI